MSNDRSAEAREGLLDSVAGKAKEVAGAVTGKDDLVQEGQLQQAGARNRKAAVADEAVADAKGREATQNVAETNREAAQQTASARAEAAREETVRLRHASALGHERARQVDRDPSVHERGAFALRRSRDLSGCMLYTSVEPCVMCAYAIRLARISVVI